VSDFLDFKELSLMGGKNRANLYAGIFLSQELGIQYCVLEDKVKNLGEVNEQG
jgi:hypothetical protein